MKYALSLTAKDWFILSDLIQAGINGDDCIISDEHLADVENLLKKINQTLILADEFNVD